MFVPMSDARYQSPEGQWTTFEPVAPAPRTRRRVPPASVPAILLIAAGTLTIISSFLTVSQTTHRLLSDAYFGTDPKNQVKIDVTTITAWSIRFTVPTQHAVQPSEGWGLVSVGCIALLLPAGRGRWAWRKPLAALASGLLAQWFCCPCWASPN